MIVFAVESLADCWDEMIGLAAKHWGETQGYRHNQPFAPSFDRYNQYALAGWFLQFTVRDPEKDNRMVGYGGAYVVPSMHTQRTIATEDTWYLLPEYRKGWNALKFFKFMEAEVLKRGAVELSLTVPDGIGTGVLCERLGYTRVSVQYSKQIHPAQSASLPEKVAS